MISEQELQQLVESISLESFGRAFLHQAKINRRLKTTGGRYQLSDHHLEFNPLFLKKENLHYLPGIIKHELVHYHLHLAGLGYQHKDPDFKLLLQKVGGSRYAPRLEENKRSRWALPLPAMRAGLLAPAAGQRQEVFLRPLPGKIGKNCRPPCQMRAALLKY